MIFFLNHFYAQNVVIRAENTKIYKKIKFRTFFLPTKNIKLVPARQEIIIKEMAETSYKIRASFFMSYTSVMLIKMFIMRLRKIN